MSGELDNLNNPSQLVVSASVGLSFGEQVTLLGHTYALASVTGSITVSAQELIISGSVSLVGGILGDGQATVDLNWATGVYKISVDHLGIYDDTINFTGDLIIQQNGDVTLQAMASVNVPSSIPFIGGIELGEVDVYLQILPGEDPSQSYFAAWTSVNLIFDTFTIGFEVDFTGKVTVLYGAPAEDLGAGDMTPPGSSHPTTYTYSMPVDLTAPNVTGTQVTVSSPAFYAGQYPRTSYSETVNSPYTTSYGKTIVTYYDLSHGDVILDTASFEVYLEEPYNNPIDLGTVYFDSQGNFHFTSTGTLSNFAPTGATLNQFGDLELDWSFDPGTTEIYANYSSANAYLQVLQQTSSGTPISVGTYFIDPVSNSTSDGSQTAALGGAVYNDQVSSPGAVNAGGLLETNYQLSHGPVNWQSLSFTVTQGNVLLGTGSFDSNLVFHFTPNGTPSIKPTSAGIDGNQVLHVYWPQDPGATSVAVSYNSLADRVINIDSTKETVSGGVPGQYIVQLVSTSPFADYSIPGYPNGEVPTFTSSPRYTVPNISYFERMPSVSSNGTLDVSLVATSYNPATETPGDSSTTVSLYYNSTNDTNNGKLIGTYSYSDFTSLNPSQPIFARSDDIKWTGFENLPAGNYYVYAVVNDGQVQPSFPHWPGPSPRCPPRPSRPGPPCRL